MIRRIPTVRPKLHGVTKAAPDNDRSRWKGRCHNVPILRACRTAGRQESDRPACMSYQTAKSMTLEIMDRGLVSYLISRAAAAPLGGM